MSFFDALGKLGKAAVGTALLPVDLAKDAATLGGTLTGDDESALARRLRKIVDNASDGIDEIDE